MFRLLGNFVVRAWPILLIGWVLVAVLIWAVPLDWAGFVETGDFQHLNWYRVVWDHVVADGEFAFLPKGSPSLEAARLFKTAFPEDILASSVVIVVQRANPRSHGLTEADKAFIEETLKPRIEQIILEEAPKFGATLETTQPREKSNNVKREPVCRVRTFTDEDIGPLLDSQDNKASLVIVELPTEFLDIRNAPLIGRIEELIGPRGELRQLEPDAPDAIPPGLDLATSGTATVGRDMIQASVESARNTEFWTITLVVFLLIVIYRAPIIALIPLLTVAIATKTAIGLLALLAGTGMIGAFRGIETYVTVLSYGAGVDYCLFLIARYKEELDDGAGFEEAIANALAKVGAALTASAGTVMCGIAMMVFAQFGKFREAGVGITLGLFVVLCAALTFTPSLLRLAGRWALWPKMPTERLSATSGWISAANPMTRLLQQDWLQAFWHWIGQSLQRRPGRYLIVSAVIMLPFAVTAILCRHHLSYGLLSELRNDRSSVIGARAVQAHFPAGMAGETTILLKHPEIDFSSPEEGTRLIRELTEALEDEKDELRLADIRTAWHPFGVTEVASKILNEGSGLSHAIRQRVIRGRAQEYYVSQVDNLAGTVTRIDLVFQDDPFSRDSIQQLQRVADSVSEKLPRIVRPNVVLRQLKQPNSNESLPVFCESERHYSLVMLDDTPRHNEIISQVQNAFTKVEGIRSVVPRSQFDEVDGLVGAPENAVLCLIADSGFRFSDSAAGSRAVLERPELLLLGETASIRDLKSVTDSDQVRIDVLVLIGVFLILVALLRQPAICLYLIITVFFSYLATLGVTFAWFWLQDPAGFAGLDWKVPMFLFTILIAVGEDYNIFLMTRVREEQERHGQVKGILVAFDKTGNIISSCGLIMAGTFSSLMAGSLVGMHQLGFALAFGVLLDTFVVRPILVPAYLIMLNTGRFGVLGRWLGAQLNSANATTKTKSTASR